MGCSNHKPVQHRDGKEPWCKKCGLTKDYSQPKSLFEGLERPQGELVEEDMEETTEEIMEEIMEDTTIFEDIREAETIETAIAYAIGAASTCWTEEQKGEFMVDYAMELHDALRDRIEVLVRDTIKTTMAMTVDTLKRK